MKPRLLTIGLAAGSLIAATVVLAGVVQRGRTPGPVEARIPIGKASLFTGVVGQGRSVIVLHGGPDFDHGYLLPDLDRFRDEFRLIYSIKDCGHFAFLECPRDVRGAFDDFFRPASAKQP
jgi:proline iminopeptidase